MFCLLHFESTPLCSAIEKVNEEIVNILLSSKDIDVNAKSIQIFKLIGFLIFIFYYILIEKI